MQRFCTHSQKLWKRMDPQYHYSCHFKYIILRRGISKDDHECKTCLRKAPSFKCPKNYDMFLKSCCSTIKSNLFHYGTTIKTTILIRDIIHLFHSINIGHVLVFHFVSYIPFSLYNTKFNKKFILMCWNSYT